MCGIVALMSEEGEVDVPALEAGMAALRHRGPDGRGQWVATDRRVALGHARLSIIDLATGQQPIANEDETLRIIVNGEFYDYEAIREDLKRRGHPFRTATDSEIALHLYEEDGAACLRHLRGEFAFVLWDERRKTLLAARDRFGIKPLFYSRQEGTLYLASEAKALVAAGLRPAWDHEGVHQLITLGALFPDRSLFKDVYQVPPGHYLLAGGGQTRLVRYWDFDYPPLDGQAPWSDGDDTAFVERFRTVLDDAVRTRLRADVPVGCYLSGGLDSSAVVGLAARHARKPVRAFTVAFDHEAYDESATAADTARQVGAEWSAVRVGERDLADGLSDSVWQSETACKNAHGVAKFLLSAHVRQAGYKVVLTGEGSDEVLAGYPVFLKTGPGPTPHWVQGAQASADRHRFLLEPSFAAEFDGRDLHRELLRRLDGPGQAEGRDPLHQAMYFWAKTVLPNYILTVGGDRMEMAHSVEGRLPLLDHHLVELLRQVPPSLQRRPPEKWLLREAARPVLTDAVYRAGKQPFQAPPAMLRPEGPLYQRVVGLLRDGLGGVPFYDRAQVCQLLDTLPKLDAARRLVLDPVLMGMASLCLLQERFGLSD